MSLINQLLKDLDQRQVSLEGGPPASAPSVAIARAHGPGRALLVSTVFVVLAALAAGAWVLFRPVQVRPVAAVAALAPKPPGAAGAVPPVQVAAQAPPAPVVPAISASVPQLAGPGASAAVAAPAKPVADGRPALQQAARAPQASVGTKPEPTSAGLPLSAASKRAPNPSVPAVQGTPQPRVARAAAPVAESIPQKQVSPQQLSDNLYKQAVVLLQQGKANEARQAVQSSLEAEPKNADARLMLMGFLVDSKDLPQATALLTEGVRLLPQHSGFWMNLARLQVESGQGAAAVVTLEQGLPWASDDPQYHAFYAALLQRLDRHDEAIKHFLTALRSNPSMPNWLVGIGVSLQAVGKNADAVEAFQRAKDTGWLASGLAAFVDQRLTQLRP